MNVVPLYQDAAMLARCGIPSSHPALTFLRRVFVPRGERPSRGGPISPKALSLAHTHTHTHTLTHTHAHTHTLSLSLTHTHSLTLRQSRGGPVVASAESSETVPPSRTWCLGFGVT